MPGTLFVVATPIGNLEDLTFRALRTLREVDLIAAEDTRRTSRLLAHYDVRKPLVSLREHNEARESPRLVERLARGESIALVSDAGTPGISDPGQVLVRTARAAGIKIVPVPGPSAITAALSVSGLAGDTGFVFAGFPPRSGSARTSWFEELQSEPRAIVFFEAPHRIQRTGSDVALYFADRPILYAREISKLNEELAYRPNNNHDSLLQPDERGEYVVVVGALDETATEAGADEIENIFGLITKHVTQDQNAGVMATAAILGLHERQVRKALKQARFSAKRAEDATS
jgi:16S rRNA (cytidine1402-2'-O)-methyltransferase